ncbi:MAG: UDP-3-O-(3-hydroxymyristoyl)glucosamine N-acyltransferase [Bacteriovoracaceae bacterium]|jgi:UDP-3-O-[3-hydroxymyristoyl] glucosamine N-acyltransferase|nr:UDP-3-O-(3-hydroxymyristoyl)glucosamine N-acyltransferase [Bacteriovoracaceae bacterium]
MDFEELNSIEKSFEILHGSLDFSVEEISSTDDPTKHSICFLKDIKNQRKVGRFSQSDFFENCCVVLEEKFYGKIKGTEDFEALCNSFPVVAKIESIHHALPKFSEPFFHKKFSMCNDLVDGRQLGSVEIHPTANIAQNVFIGSHVKIGKNVEIFPGSVVMSLSEIGEGTKIFPNVTIYRNVIIGMNCRIHSQSVIGSDGYGYNYFDGIHHKIWHMGGVEIGDDVEIGSITSIDSGTFSKTYIGSGSKIDNQVQIGHNSRVGKGVIICGQVGLAGSCIVGDFTVFGGKAGMGDGNQIGAGVQVAGAAMVNSDWPDGAKLGGHPARPLREWLKGLAFIRRESLK